MKYRRVLVAVTASLLALTGTVCAFASTAHAAASTSAAPCSSSRVAGNANDPGRTFAESRAALITRLTELEASGWRLTAHGQAVQRGARLPGERGASGAFAAERGQLVLAVSDEPQARRVTSRSLQSRSRAAGSAYRDLLCDYDWTGNVNFFTGRGFSRTVWNMHQLFGSDYLEPGPWRSCSSSSCFHYAFNNADADERVTGFTVTADIGPVLEDWWCSYSG